MGQPKEKPTAADEPKFTFPPECLEELGDANEVWLEGEDALRHLRATEAGETWPPESSP